MPFASRWLCGAASVGLVALAASGCGYGSGSSDGEAEPSYGGSSGSAPDGGSATCGELEQATIDAAEALEVEPGLGAGTFIEYDEDGTYRISTSCDASDAGPCAWDIIVTPLDDAGVVSVAPIGLEQDDAVTTDGTSVQLVASTEGDLDGFALHTAPGASLRVDALLDGGCANRYLFWVGDGALHSGAPSNPVDLVPSSE